MMITAIGIDGKAYMNDQFIGTVIGITPPLVLSADSTVFVQMMRKTQLAFERFGKAMRCMPGSVWPRHRRLRNLKAVS